MHYKKKVLLIISLAFIAGCVSGQVISTPQSDYLKAQKLYLHSWNSYHNVWLALPKTDPRKKEWVDKYHPLFLNAGIALSNWASQPSNETLEQLANTALDQVEDILIQLMIKKEVNNDS